MAMQLKNVWSERAGLGVISDDWLVWKIKYIFHQMDRQRTYLEEPSLGKKTKSIMNRWMP
jgi:hypothetical protein